MDENKKNAITRLLLKNIVAEAMEENPRANLDDDDLLEIIRDYVDVEDDRFSDQELLSVFKELVNEIHEEISSKKSVVY
ncbi:TPA: hypothetical protein DCZ15_01840 [Candidatus Falkowbacteria bacterium]|jgi:hypothetical protein|nr:MAG: hypothetical protein UV95_C0004G0029 [Candidatus Falkowbacteria bacterium GW2011_GWF2_43_32]HBA36595.1 hypothetical protein [Candidatus Falkowbacteria bacterium]